LESKIRPISSSISDRNHPQPMKQIVQNYENKNQLLEEPITKKTQSNVFSPLIRKSIKKLQNNSFSYRVKELKQYHFDVINDNAYIYENFQEKKPWFCFSILSPMNHLVMLVKVITLFNILFFFLYIPLELSFSGKLPSFYVENINKVTLCLLVLEIFVKLNTGYFENGALVNEKIKILSYYFRNYFLPNFLSFFALLSEFVIIERSPNSFQFCLF